MIGEHFSTCWSIFTAETLGATSTKRYRNLHDDQRDVKFEKISPPMQHSSDGLLVHHLSSHPLTQQLLHILSYDAEFSTREAQPEDFVAAFESALQTFEATKECKNVMDSRWTVESAEGFLTRIRHLEVETDEVMESFDVTSLFTSISATLAIDSIDGLLREKYGKTEKQLRRAYIIEFLELCLKTFFTFNGQMY
ncbi:unnamed protein product [Dibothriocephalus latus]|uniref:Uncharacterized protein n=1 Tax=Dibothriocephalus latus TaxID=60516 RepID=A0A3P7LN12_DIBLA|nr:unnamed protein product [Dibothriocephalus latus]